MDEGFRIMAAIVIVAVVVAVAVAVGVAVTPYYVVRYKGEVVCEKARVNVSHGVLYVTDENGFESAYATDWRYDQVQQENK